MGKRATELLQRQWHHYTDHHQDPTRLALQLLAMSIFIIACMVLLSALLSPSPLSVMLGVIGLYAAFSLQPHGHGHEAPLHSPIGGAWRTRRRRR